MIEKRTKPFQIKLTEQEHALLMRMAANRSLMTGKRISAGDMLREMAFANAQTIKASKAFKPAATEAPKMQPEPSL